MSLLYTHSLPPWQVPEGEALRFDFESTYTRARVAVSYSRGTAVRPARAGPISTG